MLSANSVLGKIARLPLRLIPQDGVVPMLTGAARGAKWIAHSGLHGFWLGTFERDIRRVFERTVKPGDVVYDIGAHVGLYAVIASRLGAQVIAFEPLPRNLRFLHRHISMNDLNVRVVEAAVSQVSGSTSFEEHGHAMGRIGKGPLTVRTVVVDELVAAGELPPPRVVKMDIEGGEFNALIGMRRLLAEAKPTIFLSTHGDEVAAACAALLKEAGYRLTYLRHNEVLAVHAI